ncbi:putative lysosomal acid lipase/cholesteryl ester hydrolase [Thamnophis elegans]|uniref:putative lysosomal acid lipase/cholesteryl ester hydrolase n=1 Tax=Thamnophis elegans TaxID=35005 RepID=UPI001379050C|nr:putative lysosomal acid lipase/cholesteryl ester hydrolase [Thamnophis elegans]
MWLFLAMACLIQQTTNSEESFRRRHLNPQGFMTIPEISQYWGYPSEQYEVLTDDGYYLQLNRIPYGKHCPDKEGPRPIVLLVHGFLADGRCWIANLPSNSLGFFLADAGYDVWIINLRGTTWSRRHKEFSIDQQEFWEFSFHEMGIYDVPATINFILQETKQDSLYYVGHSQGASIGFIAVAILPHFSERVKLFLSLSPVYTLKGLRGTFRILGLIPEGLVKLIWGTKEFSVFNERIKNTMIYACSYPVIDQLCLQIIFLTGGYNEKNLNVSRSDVYVGIFPDHSSVKAWIHLSQIIHSHEFKYYDYGQRNIEIYNMTKPPFYKIEDVSVPVAVWSGGKDIAITTRDIESLLPRIPRLVFYKDIPDWQHFDLIWGLDAPQRFYPDVLELMQKYKD